MVLLLTLYGFSAVNGQEIDPLMNYMEIAVKNNPTVLQQYALYQAALEKVPQVGSLPDPEFSAGVFLSPMELIGGKQLADLKLMQMFPWFGTLKAAKDEMSFMAKAKYEVFTDTKLQVIYDVQQTWFDLYKVQQAIKISEKNVDILKTLERLSLIKFKSASTSNNVSFSSASMQKSATQNSTSGSSGMNGMSGNSTSVPTKVQPLAMPNKSMLPAGGSGLTDLYRLQIETIDLENNIALLNDEKKVLIARFNSLLNRDTQELVTIPDTLISNALHIPLLKVTDSILTQNPMLSMLKYEKQALDARKEMVTKMGYPMIGLGINYALIEKNPMSSLSMNGNDMIMPMVTLSLPIFRKKYTALKTEVDKLKIATELQEKATANTLITNYYETVQNYNNAQRKITLYAKQYSLANQSLQILIKSYSSSGATLTDLLLMQQQTLNYELKQLEAVADYNTAIAKLNRLMAYLQIQ